ncbi:MAG TPA: PLP-dependent aminotransferase family protein [Thermoanaerobaculia bacterium]|jgi:DNA-binding transcriptional MocR family regulator|nr:PLP-dependent aminotransferase family protein [Thermoanaerobaculia bacterium]
MSQLDPIQFELDRGAATPLSDQLSDALQRRIEDGLLPRDSRLPTTRELAASLGINRGTVQAAYRRLGEKGLVEGRVGSGTIVRGGAAIERVPFRLSEQLSHRAATLSDEPRAAVASPLVADFSRLTPDERFFPFEEFTRTLAETWGSRRDLWQYAPPLGLDELRVEVARRLREHGIVRTPEEILVTSGAQQGLDLLFRTFTDPGDLVAMESPTYSGALTLARLSEAAILPLEMDEEGPDSAPLRGRRAKLVYVMPERQNPTGVTMGESRRAALLEAALSAGALVVEDGYEEPESGFSPLAALEPERAVWLGTLSKDLVPGFRIGWIAAPRPIVERLARVKQAADFQTPVPLQAAVAAFLRAGSDRQLRAARAAAVGERTSAMGRALRRVLPQLEWWGGEGSNPLFWLRLPAGVSGRRVAEAAAARGVAVAAGQDFDPRGEDRPELRLSASRVETSEIEPGIDRLAEAVAEVEMRSSAALSAPVV